MTDEEKVEQIRRKIALLASECKRGNIGTFDAADKILSTVGILIESPNQDLPENPFDRSTGLYRAAYNGFELASLKYKREGFKRTIKGAKE